MAPVAAAASLLIAIGCPKEEVLLYLSKPIAWRLVGCALAFAFVVGMPALVKPVWEDVISSFPSKRSAQIWGTVAANAFIQVGFALAMFPLYAFNLCRGWRIEKDKPWPWEAAASASDRERFWRVVRRGAWLVPFNAVFLGQASLRYLVLPLTDRIGALLPDIEGFPTPFTLLWQLAVCLVLEDFMFFWVHRTMHTHKFLYRNVHKWHHEYTTVVCLSSEHAHPVEFAAGNLLPLIVGPIAVRSHLFTVWMWVFLRIYVSVEEHCGFAFPWSPVRLLPFMATPDGHDFHHSHNVGVYASQFVFWDRVCGTDKAYLEHLRKKREGAAKKGE